MITISLVAVGLMVLGFLLVLHRTGDSQEDQAGFHTVSRTPGRARPTETVRLVGKAR